MCIYMYYMYSSLSILFTYVLKNTPKRILILRKNNSEITLFEMKITIKNASSAGTESATGFATSIGTFPFTTLKLRDWNFRI